LRLVLEEERRIESHLLAVRDKRRKELEILKNEMQEQLKKQGEEQKKEIKEAREEQKQEINKVVVQTQEAAREAIQVSTERNWAERKRLILKSNTIYTDLAEIITAANSDKLSLVIFKPTSVEDFIIEKTQPEWDPEKLRKVLDSLKQQSLFETDQDMAEFKVMPKLPYKFKYKFRDTKGKYSTLMIEDWEIGQLYLNCIKKDSDEQKAIKKVKEKYFDDFAKKKDLHLFLGTTYEWHVRRARNPFVIIGTFHPPIEKQHSLF
jgi:hypothetical protein